jgi:hypothetical protein
VPEIVPAMAIDSVQAKLDRAHEHIVEVDAALAGSDPLAQRVVVISRKLPPEQQVVQMDERTPQDPARVRCTPSTMRRGRT